MMQKSLKPDILTALDIAVLERLDEATFQLLYLAPRWFSLLHPQIHDSSEIVNLGEKFPFLDHFLYDAEAFWNSDAQGRIRSGPWVETDATGKELHLEAMAVRLQERCFLLIERLRLD